MPSALIEYLLSAAPEVGPKSEAQNTQVQQIEAPTHQIVTRTYKVGSKGSDCLQLMLPLEGTLETGKRVHLQCLVDTGAQANLIKEGLVPTASWKKATTPLQLVTANGLIINHQVGIKW